MIAKARAPHLPNVRGREGIARARLAWHEGVPPLRSDAALGPEALEQVHAEVGRLMSELRDANARLAAASAEARAMKDEARRRENEYRRVSLRLLQLRDEERRRLARDLHDCTAQQLAALTMNLDIVGATTGGLDARSRRALAESRSLAEQCSREVRTLAYLLHPPLLDEMGLASAVRWFVAGFAERSGIRLELDLWMAVRYPGPVETALFRVVQESLGNVYKHAHSPTASIRLTSTTVEVILEIQDQGRGYRDDLPRERDLFVPGTPGVGIQGMREGIGHLGGTFTVEFTEQGTTVRARVPLRPDGS